MNSETIIYTIIAYFIIYGAVGLLAARKIKTLEDYAVAGHKMGLIALTGTYFATFISALSFLGGIGGIYRVGITNVVYPIMWATGSAIGPIIAYKFRRVALITPAEYFEKRFGSRSLRILIASITCVALIPFFIIQLNALGAVYTLATGRSFSEGVIIGGIIVALYTVLGGIVAVAWTDVIQGFVLTAGAIVGGITVLQLCGGLDTIITNAATISTPPEVGLSPTPPGALVTVASFLTLPWFIAQWFTQAPGTGAHPQYLQRIQAAKDIKLSLRMYVYSWLVLTVIYFFFVVIGLGGRVLVPTMPEGYKSDWIFPYLMVNYTHPIIAGAVLAGIIAAAASTLDTQIHLASVSLSIDVVRNLMREISEKSALLISRAVTAILVAVAIYYSIYPAAEILALGGYTLGLMGVLYFAPVLLGLYWKRTTALGVAVGTIAGVLVFIAWQTLWGFSIYGLPPVGMGVITSFVLTVIVSLLTKPPSEELIKPYF